MSVNPAAPFLPDNDQTDMTALLLAAAVHILLVGALFFSVQWRSQAPTAVAVEVWRSGPAPLPAPIIKPEPLPEPPPPPPPPKVEAKPEPKPPPPKGETPPVKPAIVGKEEKKKKEEPKKPEPKPVEVKKEEPKKPEPKKEEPKKPEPKKEEPKPERRSFDDELQRELKQAQQQKAVHDQRARADAELRQLGQAQAEQAARALQRGLDDYTGKIRGKIKGNIVLPPGIKGNPEGIFDVTQLPTGEIINVKISKSTGNRALDEAIERAIRKSDPLPLPDQPGLFKRELKLKYRPFDE